VSTYCTHCGVVSRNACSDYKKEYLADELRRCPNLPDSQRANTLFGAGFPDAAQAIEDREAAENQTTERQHILAELMRIIELIDQPNVAPEIKAAIKIANDLYERLDDN
jgi:hypothetical protein